MLNVNSYGNKGAIGAPVTATQTTLPLKSGQGALFDPGTGNHFWLTIHDSTGTERVKVTGRTGDILILAGRAMDGTTARTWNVGACVSVEWSPTQLCEFVQGCTAGAAAPTAVTPGTYCFDKCTCFTVDSSGRFTSITGGASC
jgi:hypothetical protein